MIPFILKFSACLALIMLLYKIVFEDTSAHQFKRFYLLIAVLVSLTIPFITFTEYIEVPVPNVSIIEQIPQESVDFIETETSIQDYLPEILWNIYFMGLGVFTIRFLRNLVGIIFKIKRNPRIKDTPFINVLLTDLFAPHTFFNFIFLNRDKYYSKVIPEEVFVHEQTHAKQKHSVDVLFLEIIQVIFWFNPLIYLLKKDVKLNHEFLADRAVLERGTELLSYQQLLLEFSTHSHPPEMANAINYSSIKKRFTVMKTKTSKKVLLLRTILILPLLAFNVYGFSEKEEIIKYSSTNLYTTDTINDIIIYIDKNDNLFLNQNSFNLENLAQEINELNPNLTEQQRRNFISAEITHEEDVRSELMQYLIRTLIKCNIIKISSSNNSNSIIAGKSSTTQESLYAGKTVEEAERIYENQTINLAKNAQTETLNSPWKLEIDSLSTVEINNTFGEPSATEEMVDEYNKIVHKINLISSDERIIKVKDLNRLAFIYSKMSDNQMTKAEPYPNFQLSTLRISKNQDIATYEEVVEYNKLAKKCNEMDSDHIIILQKDVDRMEYIYSKMTKSQKSKAQKFPNIVPPPPPPPAPEPPTNVAHKIAQPANNTQAANNPQAIKTPPPAPPVDHIEHVNRMIDKGAVFYLNGEIISADKAKLTAKNSGQYSQFILHTDTNEIDENPKVYITTKPIQTKQSAQDKPILVNGKAISDMMVVLTKNELLNLKLTIEETEITNFKLKIPGIKTLSIDSNTLNDASKNELSTVQNGDNLQLFDIKTADGKKNRPIMIQLKE